jgi:uncharacterized integral membrane protein
MTAGPQPRGTSGTGNGPSAAPPPGPAHVRQHVVRRIRMSGLWTGLAAVVLVLLIFILENGQRASIGYFGAHGHLPLGGAVLLAAVGGALLVLIPGTARIIQLRRRHRLYAAPPPPGPAPPASTAPADKPPA